MLSPRELEQAAQLLSGLDGEVLLLVRQGTAETFGELNARVAGLADGLCQVCPRLKQVLDPGLDPEGPSIALAKTVQGGRIVPVRFRARPEGGEFPVLLRTIGRLSRGEAGLPRDVAERAAGLKLEPVIEAEVMTLPTCGHCPAVAEAACSLALSAKGFTCTVVDVGQAPQFVSRYNLMFTPAVVANGRDRLKGRTAEALLTEIAELAAWRSELLRLSQRLEEGHAVQVASECLQNGAITQGLCRLVGAEHFQVRLGAIVALEELGRQSPHLAVQAVARLAPLTRNADPRIRGDAAYVMGAMHCQEARPYLQLLLGDHDPQVVEAAREALDGLAD